MQRHPRKFDEQHLAFIRRLPCIVCHDNTGTQAAHVRMSDARIAKINPGVGAKPDDKYTLPLCGECHAKQHSMNELKFWEYRNIDPVLMALALYSVSGDVEEAERIIFARVVNVMAAG
jgi:hypothetical protein